MLNLKFNINKHYLLVRFLKCNNSSKEWERFKNNLWEKFPKGFYLLSSYPELLFTKDSLAEFKKSFSEAKKLIKYAFASKEFNKIISQTNKYLKWIKNEWLKSGKIAIKKLSEITKLSFNNQEIFVYVVHPDLHNGLSFPEKNMIFWGQNEQWKNYNIVYLCHEIMHIVTFEKFKNEKLMHALIELAVDEELRQRLDSKNTSREKKRKIFPVIKEMPSEIANKQYLKQEILDSWLYFLKTNNKKNILDLEKELLNNKKIKKYL